MAEQINEGAVENTEVVDTQVAETVETPEVDAPVEEEVVDDVEPPKENDSVIDTEGEQEVPPVPAFTPNFKYKVLGQEYEIPKNIQAFIKDAEIEAYFKSIHEKAGAVEHFTVKNKELTEKHSYANEQLQNITTSLGALKESIEKDDYETFFEDLNIPIEKVTAFCAKRLALQQNPDQFRNHQLQRDIEKKTRENERILQNNSLNAEKRVVDYIAREYESTMSIPDNSNFEKEFDKRAGRIGAFREEIIFRGDYALSQNKLKTTAEIVKELKALHSYPGEGKPNLTAPASTNAGGSSGKKAVVPVIPGSTGAPVSKGQKIESLDDLRNLRDSLKKK